MDFKKTRESLKRTIDEMFEPFDELDAEMKEIEADMEKSGAEKTVTIEETKDHGVVTKVVTRTVYRSRREKS